MKLERGDGVGVLGDGQRERVEVEVQCEGAKREHRERGLEGGADATQ